MVIESDNDAPASVLPYNAGTAEQSVARVDRLLVRYTQQFLVRSNTLTMHLSTGLSPLFALYGRHPSFSLAKSENPSLVSVTETGNDFVFTLATRLRQAWLAVCDTSDRYRLDGAARFDGYHMPVGSRLSTMDYADGLQVGDLVLLRRSSVEHAALLTKYGFPFLRSLRV
eukprot:1122046-Pleurochrysis_carterae.AAC.5